MKFGTRSAIIDAGSGEDDTDIDAGRCKYKLTLGERRDIVKIGLQSPIVGAIHITDFSLGAYCVEFKDFLMSCPGPFFPDPKTG